MYVSAGLFRALVLSAQHVCYVDRVLVTLAVIDNVPAPLVC